MRTHRAGWAVAALISLMCLALGTSSLSMPAFGIAPVNSPLPVVAGTLVAMVLGWAGGEVGYPELGGVRQVRLLTIGILAGSALIWAITYMALSQFLVADLGVPAARAAVGSTGVMLAIRELGSVNLATLAPAAFLVACSSLGGSLGPHRVATWAWLVASSASVSALLLALACAGGGLATACWASVRPRVRHLAQSR